MLRLRPNDSLLFDFRKSPSLYLIVLALLSLSFGCKSSRPTQATVVPQRTVVLAHEGAYLTLDPQAKNDNVTWSIIGNIFEPLVQFDGDMKLVGCLAERWENPNDLTWRFYLRHNVRFHDGKPFRAEDVAYTIRRGLSENGGGTRSYLISVKDVKVIDAYTVDIITDRPNAVLLNRLTFIFILPSSGSPSAVIQKPIGTGPYMFEAEEIPGKRLVLRANPTYWNGKASIERVKFVSMVSQEQMVEALLKGQLHLLRDFSETLASRMEASKSCKVITHDGLGVSFLGFNLSGTNKTNPFLNLKMREAFSIGLDSAALVSEALGGRATAARQLVSPVIFGFDPSLVSEPRNLERAKMLVKEALLPEAFHPQIYGTDAARLSKLAAQIRELGVDVQPELVEWEQFLDKVVNHQVPLYTMSWSCSTGDASDFLDSCIHSPDPARGYGNFNVADYRNPEVDRLIELSGQTLKTTERKRYLQQAFEIASRDIPYIPLYSRYRHYGVTNDLVWHPRRDGRLYAVDMSWKQSQ